MVAHQNHKAHSEMLVTKMAFVGGELEEEQHRSDQQHLLVSELGANPDSTNVCLGQVIKLHFPHLSSGAYNAYLVSSQ